MQRLTTALFVLSLSGFSVGCSNFSVRPGVWELTFEDVVFSETGESAADVIDSRRVLVLVESAENSDVIEVIEISPAKKNSKLLPMYADVELDGLRGIPKVKITHDQDPEWVWNMHGFVRDEFFIEGTQFHGRHRYRSMALEGAWSMKWLEDA